MWEKIGDFNLGYTNSSEIKCIQYKNINTVLKITEIGLFSRAKYNFFTISITAPTSELLASLKKMLNELSLPFYSFIETRLYLDINFKEFAPFFNVLKKFEPSIVELEAEFIAQLSAEHIPVLTDSNKPVLHSKIRSKTLLKENKNLRRSERIKKMKGG